MAQEIEPEASDEASNSDVAQSLSSSFNGKSQNSDATAEGSERSRKQRDPRRVSRVTPALPHVVILKPPSFAREDQDTPARSSKSSAPGKLVRLLKNTSAELPGGSSSHGEVATQSFSFVNFIPTGGRAVSLDALNMKSLGIEGGTSRKQQTFILEMIPNPALDSDASSSAALPVGGTSPMQCVFRMTPRVDDGSASSSGSRHTGFSGFTLNRANQSGVLPKLVPRLAGPTTLRINGRDVSNGLPQSLPDGGSSPSRAPLPRPVPRPIAPPKAVYRIVSSTVKVPETKEPPAVNPEKQHQPKAVKTVTIVSKPDGSGRVTTMVAHTKPTPKSIARPVAAVVTPAESASRPDVIPLLSLTPDDTPWANWLEVYELSGLAAGYSSEKEAIVLDGLKGHRYVYEDQQVVWKSLPALVPVDVPGLTPSLIGLLLSVGHFLESLQFEFKSNRGKKRCFNWDFLTKAVMLHEGKIGPYLCLLNWFSWACDERKDIEAKLKLPAEFSVNIHQIPSDQVLACEKLRQYLVAVSRTRPVGNEFASLLTKLKDTDLAEFSSAERVILLSFAHDVLLRDTHFVTATLERIEQELSLAFVKRSKSDAALQLKEAALLELEARLKAFDERSKTTRLEDRERAGILEEVKTVTKELETLREERAESCAEEEVARKHLGYLRNSECLGQDRHYNRYWHFPELAAGIFVESGWSSSVCPGKSAPFKQSPVVGNFVYAKRTADLQYITEDGKHQKCDSRSISSPSGELQWSFHKAEGLPGLLECLNPTGVREGRLKVKLNTLLANENSFVVPARPLPSVADSLPVALRDLFSGIYSDLIYNQFLISPPDPGWKDQLERFSFDELKQFMLDTYSNIIPLLLDKEFLALADTLWEKALSSTKNMSRIYYLVKVLDARILWERKLPSEACKTCGKNQKKNKIRCVRCTQVYHENDCMTFDDRVCSLCNGSGERTARDIPRDSYVENAEAEETPQVEIPAKRKAPVVNGTTRSGKVRRTQSEDHSVESMDIDAYPAEDAANELTSSGAVG